MSDFSWSIVCDDGTPAQGAVTEIRFNVLTLRLSGRLVQPGSLGVALDDEAARRHFDKFDGRQMSVDFAADIITSRLDVRSIDVATDFSASEEERLKQALARPFAAMTTLQALLDSLSEED